LPSKVRVKKLLTLPLLEGGKVLDMKTLYSIGEFSQLTGLSVKTLRFYHEKGILLPSSVDDASGYRLYDASKIEKARVIMRLRAMEFSIEDITAVLGQCEDEADILNFLVRQKDKLQQRIREDRDIVRSLDEIIAKEKAAQELLDRSSLSVEEKRVEPMLIAGIRMKGKYSECGRGFASLPRRWDATSPARHCASITIANIAMTMRTLSRVFQFAKKWRWPASRFAVFRAGVVSRLSIAGLTISWAAAMQRF